MILLPPRSTRTATLFPDTTLVRSRVAHGGSAFSEPAVVDDHVLEQLEALVPLAPLHQPNNLAPIRAIRARMGARLFRSEEHTSELQSLMRISYAVFCLKKKTHKTITTPIYSILADNQNNRIT